MTIEAPKSVLWSVAVDHRLNARTCGRELWQRRRHPKKGDKLNAAAMRRIRVRQRLAELAR